jgi:hypothetical protein
VRSFTERQTWDSIFDETGADMPHRFPATAGKSGRVKRINAPRGLTPANGEGNGQG